MPPQAGNIIATIDAEVSACRACERLVAWREEVAVEKRAAFRDAEYWGRGVPGFGSADARVWVVGLAPAAHGANRTGRMFTGDRSGDWLYRAMHQAGLANQAESTGRDDGLELVGARVTSVVRCAPPDNKPTIAERDRCLPFLARELAALPELRVIVTLGAYAWENVARQLGIRPRPKFGHGRGDTDRGWADCALLLPPEPAQHLHRQADRADAGRDLRPCCGAGRALTGRSHGPL